MKEGKISSFVQLRVWQAGHELVLQIYAETKKFPPEERYALGDQMRRSAVSLTSNIAEGFARRSVREKIQFYSIANGSTTELQNQLLIAKDVGYLSEEKFHAIAEKTVVVRKMLHALMNRIRTSP